MDVFEAIKRRRSIRRFKNVQIPGEHIERLIEAARLAPSGSNVQPWRFMIVKDEALKRHLRDACFNQKFVEEAPVVIVCCGDLYAWKKARMRSKEILNRGDIRLSEESTKALKERAEKAASADITERVPSAFLNVAIAIEHIVLEAVELGLGSCWVRLFDEDKVRDILKLPRSSCVVAILPIGVPDEEPEPRPRLPSSAIRLQLSK